MHSPFSSLWIWLWHCFICVVVKCITRRGYDTFLFYFDRIYMYIGYVWLSDVQTRCNLICVVNEFGNVKCNILGIFLYFVYEIKIFLIIFGSKISYKMKGKWFRRLLTSKGNSLHFKVFHEIITRKYERK